MTDELFARIGGDPGALLEALERAIAARVPVRVLGCMPHLDEPGPDAPFPYLVICPGTELPLDEVVQHALDQDLGLGMMNAEKRFTTITYGHLWSYAATGKLLVPPGQPPPGYTSAGSELRYWAPDTQMFPSPARNVLRSLLAPLVRDGAPKALLFTDARAPWFTSFVFNVYRDQLPAETCAALRLALRWHIPAHLAVNVFQSRDPVVTWFEQEAGF